MHDAIIVGAGPAGVSAALWLKQLGFSPMLIDRNATCGGLQLSNPYTNSWVASSAKARGHDVASALHQNMLDHKVDMRLSVDATKAEVDGKCARVWLSNRELITARFLVLAGGVSPRTGGLVSRLGMIVGPGTAIADTNFSGKNVAILGGGDNAFENYVFASARGARSVSIFARSIRARADMIAQVPSDRVLVGAYDLDQNRNTVNGTHFDQILVLYGYEAAKSSLLGLNLALRTDGFVSTDSECQTSRANVYAIGEIARRAHPCCITAMADGVIAAKAIQRRLEPSAPTRALGNTKRALSMAARAVLQPAGHGA